MLQLETGIKVYEKFIGVEKFSWSREEKYTKSLSLLFFVTNRKLEDDTLGDDKTKILRLIRRFFRTTHTKILIEVSCVLL